MPLNNREFSRLVQPRFYEQHDFVADRVLTGAEAVLPGGQGALYVTPRCPAVQVFGACLFGVGTLASMIKPRVPAMFKIGLTALSAIPLTFASAKAVDNAASANAAAAFAQFGVGGLAVAGQAPAGPFGPPVFAPAGPPVYTPVCWTQYVTVANGNTLVNFPNTICR